MPSNLDLVSSIYADWKRGDFSSAEWAHPDIEFLFADGLEPGSATGLAGMAEANRDRLSAGEGLRQEPEEWSELDSERVLVLHRFSARGKTSGLEIGQARAKGAALVHVRGGRVNGIVHGLKPCAADPAPAAPEAALLPVVRFA